MRAPPLPASTVVLEALDGEDFPPFSEEQALRLIAPEAGSASPRPCVRCVVPDLTPPPPLLDERFGQALAALSQRQPA